MTYLWRLKNAIGCLKPERRTLIFIDHADPPSFAVDHLEIYLVVVNVVGNLTCLGKPDMRRYQFAAAPARDQVAILHPGAATNPALMIGRCCHAAASNIRVQDNVLLTTRQSSLSRGIGRPDHVKP